MKHVGSSFQVRFTAHRGTVKGHHSQFTKIAFVDRSYRGARPAPDEEWMCRVVYDTKPAQPKKGVLFLVPTHKLTRQETWDVIVVGEPRHPRVVFTGRIGERVLDTKAWDVQDVSQALGPWPRQVLERVATLLHRCEQERLAQEKWLRRRSLQLALADLPNHRGGLTGGRPGSGDEVEFPFQWLGEWLTNGTVMFPRVRPQGSEWQDYPIPAVPAECWEMFLSGLEGKFLDELIPFHRQVTTRKGPAKVVLTPRQRELEAVVQGQMWQGNEGVDRVAVGRNILFAAAGAQGQPLFLVDNPGIGAIYVLDNRDVALSIANGTLTRSEAIKRGVRRIVHSSRWKEKVAAVLQAAS